MKTNTLLLIGGAAALLYFIAKPKPASATPYASPLPMPPVWQGPVYAPSWGDYVETGVNAALRTIPGLYM